MFPLNDNIIGLADPRTSTSVQNGLGIENLAYKLMVGGFEMLRDQVTRQILPILEDPLR